MMVYGGTVRELEEGEVRAAAPGAGAERQEEGEMGEVDAARGFLIQAGEMEQGLADRLGRDGPTEVVDAAARWWLARFRGGEGDVEGVAEAVRRMEGWEGRLRVKVPEGFAFYGLYPEQYALAAERWARGVRAGRAVVVGIRSIGTALSAVVAEVLRGRGWLVRRVTVRPRGHPYEREVELRREHVAGAEWGLVVDEGPGRSGSSFVAAARAMERGGLARERIVFFPGHGGMPGRCGSAEVRGWWETTRREVVGAEDVRWNGKGVEEYLVRETARNCGGRPLRAEKMAAGKWRAFDKPRWKVVTPEGRGEVWVFQGVDVVEESVLGYRRRAWVPGQIVEAEELDDAVVHGVVDHLMGRWGSRMEGEEVDGAVGRLREMAACNIGEGLGAERAREFEHITGRLAGRLLAERRAAVDGRLGPWEWVKEAGTGRLVKLEAGQPGRDHTCIGRQTVYWDAASAMVDWAMPAPRRRLLVKMLGLDEGCAMWHAAAYGAFRVGMCAMCGEPEGRYRQMVEEALGELISRRGG